MSFQRSCACPRPHSVPGHWFSSSEGKGLSPVVCGSGPLLPWVYWYSIPSPTPFLATWLSTKAIGLLGNEYTLPCYHFSTWVFPDMTVLDGCLRSSISVTFPHSSANGYVSFLLPFISIGPAFYLQMGPGDIVLISCLDNSPDSALCWPHPVPFRRTLRGCVQICNCSQLSQIGGEICSVTYSAQTTLTYLGASSPPSYCRFRMIRRIRTKLSTLWCFCPYAT